MAWRLARSLERLRAQVDALAPGRSKASDGTIGDASHAASKSDHNPDDNGVVKALDITHDPAGGCDCNAIAEALVASRDGRIQYIIWNRQIINRETSPWVWRPYTGNNGHTHHIHISVDEKPELYDDATDWSVKVATDAPVGATGTMTFTAGIYSAELAQAQDILAGLGYHEVGAIDGKWGSRTRGALNAFRADNGLPLSDQAILTTEDRAAMAIAPERVVAPERAEVTAAELAAQGSRTISTATGAQAAAVAAGGAGAVGIVAAMVQGGQQAAEPMVEAPDAVVPAVVEPVVGFADQLLAAAPIIALVAVVIAAGIGVWLLVRNKRARVEDQATGRHA